MNLKDKLKQAKELNTKLISPDQKLESTSYEVPQFS